MPPADVAARLVLLKDLFPGSDVARMVELAPGCVSCSWLVLVLAVRLSQLDWVQQALVLAACNWVEQCMKSASDARMS